MKNGLSTTSSPVSAQAPPKANPVAHEAAVIVTGARPGQTAANRELFTETTTTVLVFENGAVISLSAAVIPGQLLFLTHQDSKREVVAQVTHKRASRPASCYVEVEFTEPFPKFWGIDFPKQPELAAVTSAQKEAAEMVQSSEVTDDDPGELSFAPSMQEVVALKEEVEVLRKQLKLMQSQPAVATPPAPIEDVDARAAAAQKIVESYAEETIPEAPSDPTLAAAEIARVSPRVAKEIEVVEQAASEPAEEPSFNEEDLLPKVSLDFGSAPIPPEVAKGLDPQELIATAGGSRSPRRALLLAALLLLGLGAAYFEHWIPGLSKNNAAIAEAPRSKTSATPRRPETGGAGQPGTATASASRQSGQSASSLSGHADYDQQASIQENERESDASAMNPRKKSGSENQGVMTSVASKRAIRSSSDAPAATDAPAVEASGIVPPKLVKSVRPNPPAEALRGFISGNVALDAVVENSGQISSIKVVSGPETLRSAAIDALRHYKYEPAMQGGHPVAAHISVTVQFWYEP